MKGAPNKALLQRAQHLVEELAGILWRKRRLRLAEGAACRRGLVNVASDRRTVDAALVHLDIAVNDTSRELADVDQAEATTTCAVDLLQTGKARAYEKALAMLRDDTQERWTELSKPILGLLDLSDQQIGILQMLRVFSSSCGTR
jgi:hypothetical protein